MIDGTKEDAQKKIDQAVRRVLGGLEDNPHPTRQEIADEVEFVALISARKGIVFDEEDEEEVRRLVEAEVYVTQDYSSGLEGDKDGHIKWLDKALESSENWWFWNRYAAFMNKEGRPSKVLASLDHTTNQVLGDLEDPTREGEWKRKGLVIGQVQSGKTGQFIGLSAKAADTGYKLIIILAGMTDDLRAQTQARVDEGLLGFDTEKRMTSATPGVNRIGAGLVRGFSKYKKQLRIASLTTSTPNGDFSADVAKHANIPIGGYPVVLVIKKHPALIGHVQSWMKTMHGEQRADGTVHVKDLPLLVIDDEADNASINTNKPEKSPTAINRAIRDLLNTFDQASYVGYTATPYANVFIDPKVLHDEHGPDLFPTSFIRTLPAPSNYLGPERLFGLPTNGDEEGQPALPLTRKVDDASTWMSDKHKKDWEVSEPMPASLKEAVNAFVLTCAIRRIRTKKPHHNSMLVHVTRFKDVQQQVKEDVVAPYLFELKQDLQQRFSPAAQKRENELWALWEKDFKPTTDQFPADDARRVTWKQVRDNLREAIAKITVKAINGDSTDSLDYYRNRDIGLSVIAVGGQMLSRGLTLEGLSVSYYLRLSRTYDTLLQMGRWFGYRPGYEDLCRLYTTGALIERYEWVTRATDELSRDIEEMSVLGADPSQFRLKVLNSPLGMDITAANKRRSGTTVRVSFSDELAETTVFPLNHGVPVDNASMLDAFVRTLDAGRWRDPEYAADREGMVWSGVPADVVASEFFDKYRNAEEAQRVRPDLISKYIRQLVSMGELGRWTVRVINNRAADAPYQMTVGGQTLNVTHRAGKDTDQPGFRKTVQRLLSPSHESFDLTKEQKERALTLMQKNAQDKGRTINPKIPTGKPLRYQRDVNEPLLLIYPLDRPDEGVDAAQVPYLVGFGASFPHTDRIVGTEYTVVDRWFEMGDEDTDEGDDDE